MSIVSNIVASNARIAAHRAIALAALLGLSLALGACSKCDLLRWQSSRTGPQSCHEGPPSQ